MDATVDGILGYLSSQTESKGVPASKKGVPASKKGVIKDGEGKPNPNLSSPEKARYSAIFKLFKNIVFPPDEAKRLKGTKISKVIKADKVTSPEKGEKGEKSKVSWKLLAALGAMAAAALLFDTLGPIGRFITKAAFKLKTLGSVFMGITKILDKVLGTSITKSIDGIVTGIKGFFSGIGRRILGFLGVGGKAAKGGSVLAKGGGLLKTLLSGAVIKIGGKLLKVLKFLPVIGSFISFGFAIARFKKGQIIPGIFEILSGILGFLGPLKFISLAIDGGLMLYDMFTAKNKKREKAGLKKLSFFGWVKQLGSKLISVLAYLPGIGGIIRLGQAFGAFKSGNIGEGLKLLGTSIFAFIGGKGLGDLALKGINFIASMFSGEKEEGGESTGKKEGFFDIMKNVWKKASKIVMEKAKAVKDWALKKLNPLNWFKKDKKDDKKDIKDKKDKKDSLLPKNKELDKKDEEVEKDDKKGSWWSRYKQFVKKNRELNAKRLKILRDKYEQRVKKNRELNAKRVKIIKDKIKSSFNWLKEKKDDIDDKVLSKYKELDEKRKKIIRDKIKALKDSASKQRISEAEKLKKAKAEAAGHSSWDEYKASGWKWKTDKKKDSVTGDTLKITKDLASLAQQQLAVLTQINENIRLLVGKGGSGATNTVAGQNQQMAPKVFDTGFDSANNIETQPA